MMHRVFVRLMLLLSLVFAGAAVPAWAEEKPTPEMVQDLTHKAAAVLASQELDAARKLFMAEGPFRFGEIYVNVIDNNGTWKIYPPNPRNEEKSVLNVRDADGKLLVQEVLAIAATPQHEGWVRYRWLNPTTNRIEPKMSYVIAVPGKNLVTYIGLYYAQPEGH